MKPITDEVSGFDLTVANLLAEFVVTLPKEKYFSSLGVLYKGVYLIRIFCNKRMKRIEVFVFCNKSLVVFAQFPPSGHRTLFPDGSFCGNNL